MSAPEERNAFPNSPQTSTTQHEQQSVANLTDTAKHDLASLGEDVKQQAQAISDEAKTQIGDMVGDVTDKARGYAAEQKDLLAEQLEGVASALDRVASELEDDGEPTARYARMIADGADNLLTSVADRDVDDLMAMAQDFGRRQPVAFLGAAALLGFAASRFVLASSARRNDSTAGSEVPTTSTSVSSTLSSPTASPALGTTTPSQPYGSSTLGGGNGAV